MVDVEHVAPVVVDGIRLFDVSGASAFPADRRAALIAGRITEIAADRSIMTNDFRLVKTEASVQIYVRDKLLMGAADADS